MIERFSLIETLRDFVAKANELGIEYMVTGSFAMSLYGEIRLTRDIDIVVELSAEKATPFANLFVERYYVSDFSIKQAILRRSMFNVIDQSNGSKIDCIIKKNTEFARHSFDRRRKVMVSGIEFWTTTKEDLILAKLHWARDTHSEVQIRDIANLTSNEYDSKYVETWIEILSLQIIWSKVKQWKILHERTEN